VQLFSCPECSAPARDILQGKELEVFALEVQDEEQEWEVAE